MFAYVCIYIHTYIYTHIYLYTHTHSLSLYTHICIYRCVYTHKPSSAMTGGLGQLRDTAATEAAAAPASFLLGGAGAPGLPSGEDPA